LTGSGKGEASEKTTDRSHENILRARGIAPHLEDFM
jgi:hypothetical protein